jgi:transcriptional regulator with XRE-family HTH domain
MYGGDLVREARRRAGLTQRELADRAGTTQSSIARLETGQTSPSFDLVVRLIRLCGFRLDVFLDPYDDSDLAQAEALLRSRPDDRIDDLESGLEFADELSRAYESATRG